MFKIWLVLVGGYLLLLNLADSRLKFLLPELLRVIQGVEGDKKTNKHNIINLEMEFVFLDRIFENLRMERYCINLEVLEFLKQYQWG